MERKNGVKAGVDVQVDGFSHPGGRRVNGRSTLPLNESQGNTFLVDFLFSVPAMRRQIAGNTFLPHRSSNVNNMIKNGSGIVRNGNGLQVGGYRQIVISPQGEIRPVCKAVRKGLPNKQTTYQVPHPGDIVWGIRWYPSVAYVALMTKDGLVEQTAEAVNDPTYLALLHGLPQAAKEWLKPAVGQASMLPEGCGWSNDMTTHDFRKKQEIADFFHGAGDEWLEGLWKEAKISPYHVLPQKWELASPMPDVMDNHVIDERTSYYTVRQYTQWVLWRDNGRVDVFTPPAHIEEIGGTLPSIIPSRTERAPFPMPIDVIKVVRIVRGGFRDKAGNSYGCSWTLHAY